MPLSLTGRRGRASDSSVYDRSQEADGVESDLRERLPQVDALMRRVRWFAVAFTLAQFILYQPPEGVQVEFHQLGMGAVIATLVIAINLVSLAARHVEDTRALDRIGIGQLVADAALTTGIVWLFSFDSQSALWALLILPVIEGAIRRQHKGALLTWAGCAIAYTAREIVASQLYPGIDFEIESVTYRMGIVLIVAVASGYLAKSEHAQTVFHRQAREESERRAELLRIVAAASRQMGAADPENVLSTVMDSVLAIGFKAGAIGVFNLETGAVTLIQARGIPEEMTLREYPSEDGITGLVRTHAETVVLDDYTEWGGSHPDARALGFRAAVGTPIRVGSEIEAVLLAGTTDNRKITSHETECLELLAAQAGTALTQAKRSSEKRVLEDKLEHEALHDSLTGLPNRSLFFDRLYHCMERKESAQSPTAVLFMNLDGFKRINDSLGHDAGDKLLRSVADRLVTTRGPGDTVARYSGDEFAVLIEEPESERAALASARQMLEELILPFQVNDREVVVSGSIGIAYGSQSKGHARDFLREADIAMVRAKDLGGGRAEIYRPEMVVRAERRLDLEMDIRHGLEEASFVMHYQPVVSVGTNHVVGLEALIRWQHPQRGLLYPLEFIPFAEETDLIVPLGHWILHEVCRQVAEWRATYDDWPRIPVSINLSAKEFRQENFVDLVVSAFEKHEVHPADLIFEVTESVLMRDNLATLSQMRRLRRLGVRMAIDDFGLGYSSLSYLKQFPFSILKIDKSFVKDITAAAEDQAIVRSVLTLANDLGIRPVAEGVETAQQLEYLEKVGCDAVQGFYLFRPMVATAVPDVVIRSRAIA